MKKSFALLFALLITGFIAGNFYIFSNVVKTDSSEIKREKVTVARVIDGDTLELEDGRKVRLVNINSPEKGTFGSDLSFNFLKSFENQTVEIEAIGTDKYRRTLGRIYNQSLYLNLDIVKQGLASKFLVQESELGLFSAAEEEAVKNSLGIWKKSQYSDCFESKIDKNKEIVELINSNCNSINVNGWFLKDESRKTYKFGSISLGMVIVHSSEGPDNSTDLFWNSKTNVWNSDRDTLYLFDSGGNIVHHKSYGY